MIHKKIRNVLFLVITVSLIFVHSLFIQAAPVDETEARQIAVKWAKILNLPEMKPLATQQVGARRITPFTRADQKVAYLFEQKAGGFVLVGADDRFPAILAYSKENRFDPEVPVAGIFLDGLAFKLKRAEEIGVQRNEQWDFILSARPASYNIAAVQGPLLTTTWRQGSPYNNLCPVDRGERCPTGCGPTAVAQIMRYHKHPARGTGSNSYTSRLHGFDLSADFDTEYDWDNMPNKLTSSNTQTEIDAVAKLCYHVGIAVEVDYDKDGSSSSMPACIDALATYFYYKHGQKVMQRNFSNERWFYMMRDEIRTQRPVLYSIRKADGSGHFVVLDGTDDTGITQLVHINMGWGGYSDGWYAYGAFPKDYNYKHKAAIGIEPDNVANRTHYVDGIGGDDSNDGLSWQTAKKTIHASIYSAVSGDTILVKYGTYNITSPIKYGGKNIKLASDDGTHNSYEDAATDATQCIIDAGGNCIVFYFYKETSDAVVDGFTIMNGSPEKNGGIYCICSSPTITNNTITNNSSSGGIFCNNSSPTITNNTITDNSSGFSGGGIYCKESSPTIENNIIMDNSTDSWGGGISCRDNSSPTIINNIITRNSADRGGGIYCSHSSPTIKNNTITGNSSGFSGGGIYCKESSPTIENNIIMDNSTDSWGGGISCRDNSSPTINNNIIKENSAGSGGGIECYNSSPTITNNTIKGNSVKYFGGGGIGCGNNSSPTIINNIIEGNFAETSPGGGIACFNSSLKIISCTITNNSTEWGGGGIFCQDSSSTIINTILWNDSPEEIYLQSSTITVTCSDVQGGWEGEGNIDANPHFVDVDDGDYHLQEGSPCIDTGIEEWPYDGTTYRAPETDIDGHPRPLGNGVDIGAYEYGEVITPGDVSGNDKVTAYDAALVLQHLSGVITLSASQQDIGDVDGETGLTTEDADLILKRVVGLIQKFPVEASD